MLSFRKKLLIVVLLSLTLLNANSAVTTKLKIKVTNIDVERGGNIMVMIFKQDGFPLDHTKAISTQIKTASKNTLNFVFDVNIDELAVKILHDEDKNNKTTKNWTGLWPKEGLGFSNKQEISIMGPPKYKNSKLSKQQFQNGLNISVVYK